MPLRTVLALVAVGVLLAAIVGTLVVLAPRHKLIAAAIVAALVVLVGWVIFILPAYWD